jgi:hypothetical protein
MPYSWLGFEGGGGDVGRAFKVRGLGRKRGARATPNQRTKRCGHPPAVSTCCLHPERARAPNPLLHSYVLGGVGQLGAEVGVHPPKRSAGCGCGREVQDRGVLHGVRLHQQVVAGHVGRQDVQQLVAWGGGRAGGGGGRVPDRAADYWPGLEVGRARQVWKGWGSFGRSRAELPAVPLAAARNPPRHVPWMGKGLPASLASTARLNSLRAAAT